MKYKFIKEQEGDISVKRLCYLLDVSRSAYYRWQQCGLSQRERSNQTLLPLIKQIHEQSRRVYGSTRVCNALRQQGILCSRNRIARIMHAGGIRAKTVRRYKTTTQAGVARTVAPDLVQRNFTAVEPNRVWTTDITYI